MHPHTERELLHNYEITLKSLICMYGEHSDMPVLFLCRVHMTVMMMLVILEAFQKVQ